MNCYYHTGQEAIGVCVSCGKPICPECKVVLMEKFFCNPCADKMYLSKVESTIEAENTSGEGKSTNIPKEIRGWNWGGFFLTWIWGIGNKSWLAVLLGIIAWITSTVADQIPMTGWVSWPLTLLVLIIIGMKGNQWAWQNKRWDDISHFKKTQRTWGIWGFILFLVFFALGIFVAMAEL